MTSATTKLKQNILKICFESFLIISSVLLALVLNEYRGQLKADEERARAMQMIEVEINSNLDILNKWIPYHNELLVSFDNALSEIAQNPIEEDPRSYILHLMPRGLIQDIISRSAWDSLQQVSGSVSLDMNDAFVISRLYKIQETGVESTMLRIIDIVNSRESMRASNLEETLYIMRSTLQEFVAQEKDLVQRYKQALNDLNKEQV